MSRSGAEPWHGRHLWMYLHALGFAEAPPFARPVTLGEHMFDKPNRDAFYMVSHFLFSNLHPSRCKESFRTCWPPFTRPQDTEFRKLCCGWLKNISDECGSDFPPIVASLFLSPGGLKFTFLMFSFARYVALQKIKRDAGDDFLFESLSTKVKDLPTAIARNKVAFNRYVQVLHKEASFIQQYEKKAQNLVKQVRDQRAESALLQTQLLKFPERDDSKKTAEMVQRVQSMWASVMGTLTFLKEEKEVVDSVLKGDVDQYVLDGTDAHITIPRRLVDTIENYLDTLKIEGNVFEAGKVNLVTVVQLLNESLKILIQEHRQVDHKELKLNLPSIESKIKLQNQALSRLEDLRRTIKDTHLPNVIKSINDKQKAWEHKWEQELGPNPFHAIKKLDSTFELLSPIAPLSFNPASEDALKQCVFSQYPLSLDSVYQKSVRSKDFTHSLRSLSQTLLAKPSIRTPCVSTWTPSAVGMKKSRTEDSLKQARQQLAEQMVDEVLDKPQSGTPGRGMEIQDMVSILSSDPFLSKKQLPRTPEPLISDIRSSWRKAIQSEDLSCVQEHVQTTPDEHGPLSSIQADSSETCFSFDSNLSVPFESSVAGHGNERGVFGLPTRLPNETMIVFSTQGLHVNEPIENNKLTCVKQMPPNTLDHVPDTNAPIVKDRLSQGNVSAHSTLSWDSSQWVESGECLDSREVIQFGISHETFLEDHGNRSLNVSEDLWMEDGIAESEHEGAHCFMERQKRMELEAIRSRLEAVKSSMRKPSHELEDLYKSPARKIVKHKSESCLSLQYVEKGELFSPAENRHTLDLDYMETSPRVSLVDFKLALPQLPAISPFEESFTSIEREDLHMLEMQEYEQDEGF